MSSRARVDSAIDGQESDFGTILSHTPATLAAFGELYAEFWQNGSPGPVMKELTRLRNARVTDCGF
ncbi:MAG: hypothetical protein NXH85_17380 [Pseudomonadaceae bacterium]|nr:hypothetical protein [Pseudomonadaceae bacterium]